MRIQRSYQSPTPIDAIWTSQGVRLVRSFWQPTVTRLGGHCVSEPTIAVSCGDSKAAEWRLARQAQMVIRPFSVSNPMQPEDALIDNESIGDSDAEEIDKDDIIFSFEESS